MFVSRRLTTELLGQIAEAGFEAVEIFGTRGHFDYTTKQEVQAIASALSQHGLALLSLHAGDTLRQPELAATLKRIAKNGAAEFYRLRRFSQRAKAAHPFPSPKWNACAASKPWTS